VCDLKGAPPIHKAAMKDHVAVMMTLIDQPVTRIRSAGLMGAALSGADTDIMDKEKYLSKMEVKP
jgi:hypothetical protein